METSDILVFFVNGKRVTIHNPDPEILLLPYLRKNLHLTGTKAGCKEGGCGACTVMLSSYDGQRTKCEILEEILKMAETHRHYAVNACLIPICHLHGLSVTTVEGIGSVKSKLHPVQRAISDNHGTQCGFCTPGIVMSVYALMRNNPVPNKQQLYEALDSNLCRCTGYRPILQGLYTLTEPNSNGCQMGEECCQVKNAKYARISDDGEKDPMEIDGNFSESLLDKDQEFIFPPELQLRSSQLHSESLCFKSETISWYRPTSLQELLNLKKKFPHCKLVTGNTGLGIDVNVKDKEYPVLVSTQMIVELHEMNDTDKGLSIGSSVSLTDVDTKLKQLIHALPAWKSRVFVGFREMLRHIAGLQVRNVASIGGNIMSASPISDINPMLLACGAVLSVVGNDEQHKFVQMDKDFFISRKKTILKQEDVLLSVLVPFTTENEYFYCFKQANRKEVDKAIVNAAMFVCMDGTREHKVKDIRLAFGGMAEKTVMATKTAEGLKGRIWDSSLLELACSDSMLSSDLQLSAGSLGGMIAYRRTLCLSFFFRFYNSVLWGISRNAKMPDPDTMCQAQDRAESEGSQFYSINKATGVYDTVGKPLVHRAAQMQCTGEALYMDDIPVTEGELFVCLVTSTKSHARIVSMDPSPALLIDGVVTFVDHRDVPVNNEWDIMERVFAVDKVIHEGQVIGAVVATSPAIAQRAARAVDITMEDLTPIMTIQDSIDAGTVHPTGYTVERGNPSSVFSSCAHVVEGEMHVNAQEHFYLEPNGCVVYPKDGGTEIEVISTTQSPTQMQKFLRRALGFPSNKIHVHVKRLGGGFGGKESRNASLVLPTAVAALKTGRPVRCVLDRNVDMCLTGTRHPAYMKYKIGFEPDGKLTALDADIYLNMGCTLDLSPAVLETALLTSDNAYKIDNFCMRGHLCETNLSSCTAFRGFGGPQAIAMAESWISHVADVLQLPYEQVRERNFYHSGDVIPCGQVIRNCNVQRCWDECIQQSGFDLRKKVVEDFNRDHTWRKRGIAVTPLKYGLAFLQKSMNQGTAHVNMYTDGTVLVFHGGVEMGQGLHTKMIQVVSRELEIPTDSVHIMETSVAVTPNTGPTAASMSTDLYGAAIIDACKTLSARLSPYKKAQPNATMREWAQSAHKDQVSLSACGFHSITDVCLDWSKAENSPFTYFSFGAACTEVEIDCLTGDHKVLRTDIVMDVGYSLNPAIDIGQVEGAFVQGYGLYMLEDYKVSPEGIHVSKGPSTYKIPSFGNIPRVFNVSLLKDSENPRALYSSKGIGEPPLCLATSVLVAVKKAISAARQQNGLAGFFRLDTPATPDKIRMACGDCFAEKFSKDLKEEEGTPWNVKL